MTGSAAPLPSEPGSGHLTGDSADELELEALEHEKDLLRATAKVRRNHRTAHERAAAAAGVARQITDLVESLGLVEGDVIAAYTSREDEPGTMTALASLRKSGIDVLLPVLGPALNRQWGLYTGVADLAQRAPGRPLEPTALTGGPQVLQEARVILVPALAVDDHGIRLGRGGGWYDRVLLHARPDALVAAVVFDDECHHPPLPRAGHDVAVSAVLTPSRWWRLGA